jgi:DNA-directed RNA polymerase II subunit RPB1
LIYCGYVPVNALTTCRYDPDPSSTVIEEDKDLLESYLLVPEADFVPELQSPWLLRIELDKMMMLDKRLECAEVASKIGGAYYGLVHVINAEDNAEKLVLRLRLVDGERSM